MLNKLLLLLIFSIPLISLSACNTTPKVLQGTYTEVTSVQAKAQKIQNKTVRWSGYITQTRHTNSKTCFEVIETEKYKSLRPKKIIPQKSGRFLACKDGFLEPKAFDKRFVTITGDLKAYKTQKIDDFDYLYPVIDVNIIYIWREQPRLNNYSNFSPYYSFVHFHY